MKPYYHPRIFARVHYALIDMFNSIEFNRYDENFNIVKILRVPIVSLYDKGIAEFMMNTTSTKKESKHSSPIFGLRLVGMNPNTTGKTTTNHIRKVFDSDSNTFNRDVNPSPWILNYTLSLYTETAQDFFQLIEQIVPYFSPYLTLRIKEFEFNNIERDIPVTLSGVDLQFSDEEREKHRSLVANFSLQIKVDFYSPPTVSNIIKYIETNINMNNSPASTITNIGIENMTVEDYNKALNEIAEVASIPNSIVVSKVNLNKSSEYSVVLNASRDPEEKYSLVTLPAGTRLKYVEMLVTDTFDDLDTTVSIGTAISPNLIMATSDNNPFILTRYSLDIDITLQEDTEIFIYYNQADATKGTAEIKLKY